MIGETVSHYQIVAKLGHGGMGVVYKALDTTLDRHVAIKFLPQQFKSDKQAKKRFIQEAKAASALNHANIAVVHEIGETPDGQMFIVMACYEGQTLKDKLDGEALSVDKAIMVASQIAAGLSKAHEKRILHRDIKPANVLFGEDGQAILADFGLAKLAGQTKVTKTGVMVGTISYMSPEQASGGEVDHRSDIFSLGVTLYECVTGRLPFKGDHPAAYQYSVNHSDPMPLTDVLKDAPRGLQAIVDRALQKDPNRRYQTVADMRKDMIDVLRGVDPSAATRIDAAHGPRAPTWIFGRRFLIVASIVVIAAITAAIIARFGNQISERPDSSGIVRLAILPFENLGPPEVKYFADGITEEIRAKLGGLSNLAVIDRTSVEGYENSGKPISQIGRELSVEYVIAGAVRWQEAGDVGEPQRTDGVRITPRLVRVGDGQQLWIKTYTGSVEHVFDVQLDVAMQVVSALAVKLLASEIEFLEKQPTDNIQAFDLYLQAGAPVERIHLDEESLYRSIYLYERAIELDPTFAAAHARLARAYTGLYWHHERRDTLLRLAERELDAARALDADAPQVRLAHGDYLMHAGDADAALREFRTLRQSQPNNAAILTQMGLAQTRQGNWEQAIISMEKALEVNPRSTFNLACLANRCVKTRKYDKADRYFEQFIALSEDGDTGHYYGIKAWIHVLRNGDVQAALDVVNSVPSRWAKNPFLIHTRGWLEAFRDNYSEAARLFDERIPYQWGIPTHVPAQRYFNRAFMFSLMNQHDHALALYDSARIALEKEVAIEPTELAHGALGIAYAGLGRASDAVREARTAVEMAKGSAWYEPILRTWLARTYVMVGEHEAAVDELSWVLAAPGDLTVPLLKVDPRWDPLQSREDFQRLVR